MTLFRNRVFADVIKKMPYYIKVGSKFSDWCPKRGEDTEGRMDRRPSAGTFLVAQWLRICLAMQGTPVQSVVREDFTCHGATEPMHRSY